MAIRLLKFTEYTENALCIYRNFCNFSKIIQLLIALRIIAEFTVTSCHCVVRTIHYLKYPECKNDVLYFYLTSANSMVLVILGCLFTKKYKFFIIHLNSGVKFFNTDKNYVKNLQSKNSVFTAFVFIFSIVKVLIFGYVQFSSVSSHEVSIFWHYVFQLNLLMCDFRFIFEFLVLYCVLHVMSEQLLSVTRSIDKDLSKTDSQQLIAEVDKWSVIYKHIRESAKLFNDIFGVQLTVMLTTTMFYYIIFLYTMASQGVKGRFTLLGSGLYLGTLSLMLVILGMVSCAAQAMENSADILRRRLCKLLICSVSNSECYKVTRDLLRMMSTRPIRARAFGSIHLDMTLLPTCVSFFTTYTVIALQFNNVL